MLRVWPYDLPNDHVQVRFVGTLTSVTFTRLNRQVLLHSNRSLFATADKCCDDLQRNSMKLRIAAVSLQ
jgi:hypothetical protein